MLRVTVVSPRHTARVSPTGDTAGAGAPVAAVEPVAVPLPTRLQAITNAYAAGDAPLAERLFLGALDEDLAWDMVCAVAARGMAAHRAAPHDAPTHHTATHGAEAHHTATADHATDACSAEGAHA